MTGLKQLFSVVAVAVLVTACLPQQDDEAFISGPGANATNPSNFAAQQSACVRRGGEFREAGKLGLMTCFTTPKDAGKSCAKSSDCATECLARSRTCAPIQPLFGCNDLLDSAGRMVTLCVD